MPQKDKAGISPHSSKRLIKFPPIFRVLSLAPGEFISLFKGEGQDFVGLRPHQPGDDWKKIHWPSLAKTGLLYTIEKETTKSLIVIVALDCSSSMGFGIKPKIVDDFLESVIAALVWRGNNFLGFLGFSEKVEEYLSPRSGKERFIELQERRFDLKTAPKRKTDICAALHFLAQKARMRSVIFFISDFLDKTDFTRELKLVSKKFDFIPVVIQDPREFEAPEGFRVDLEAMETFRKKTLLLDSKAVTLKDWGNRRTEALLRLFLQHKIEPIFLQSDKERQIFGEINRFFQKRRRVRRR